MTPIAVLVAGWTAMLGLLAALYTFAYSMGAF